MQERQATIEGVTHALGPPFLVIATQNPIEYEGTYPLPEAQLDRFLLRTAFGYPSRDDEVEVLDRRIERREDEAVLEPLVDRETLIEMQRTVETVHARKRRGYCVDIVGATRESHTIAVGASPRGSLALIKLARAEPPSRAGTTSFPTTSRRSPFRRSRTASYCDPSCGCSECPRRMSYATFSRTFRRPKPKTSQRRR